MEQEEKVSLDQCKSILIQKICKNCILYKHDWHPLRRNIMNIKPYFFNHMRTYFHMHNNVLIDIIWDYYSRIHYIDGYQLPQAFPFYQKNLTLEECNRFIQIQDTWIQEFDQATSNEEQESSYCPYCMIL